MLYCWDIFFNWLIHWRFNVLSNNRVIKKGFILKQITSITNVFFNQMMNISDVSHLINLISYYTTHKKNKADNSLRIQTQKLATADDTLLIIWKFFDWVHK